MHIRLPMEIHHWKEILAEVLCAVLMRRMVHGPSCMLREGSSKSAVVATVLTLAVEVLKVSAKCPSSNFHPRLLRQSHIY
jgi:hypothetical protein